MLPPVRSLCFLFSTVIVFSKLFPFCFFHPFKIKLLSPMHFSRGATLRSIAHGHSPSAVHACGGWPDSFGYKRVGSFATSEPSTSINMAGGHSRGVSSYECFLREVVGKYWPSSGLSPLAAQGIPVGLPILLVTSDDLLPRRLRTRLCLKYDGHLSCSYLIF